VLQSTLAGLFPARPDQRFSQKAEYPEAYTPFPFVSPTAARFIEHDLNIPLITQVPYPLTRPFPSVQLQAEQL
jgi:hypothetical protein